MTTACNDDGEVLSAQSRERQRQNGAIHTRHLNGCNSGRQHQALVVAVHHDAHTDLRNATAHNNILVSTDSTRTTRRTSR